MGGLFRRDFLKLCMLGAGAFVLEHCCSLVSHAKELLGGRQVSRYTGSFLKGVPTTCEVCEARCGIIGFLEGNQLCKIGGNPRHPNSRGRVCSRGLAGVNLERDPERLLFPMIRAGKRGDANWEKVSWGRALDEIAAKLKTIQNSGRTDEFFFHLGAEESLLERRFLEAFGRPTVVDEEGLHHLNRAVGLQLTWGVGREVPDVANSRYILNFGANPYETHELYVGLIGRLIEARLTKGAKLVTFDPRLSRTAGNSDEWFPVRPGTDGVVALAMAHTIMKSGLHDNEFLERWTNVSPSMLSEHLSRYTPEMAEETSGVKAHDIVRLAQEFARAKPATTLSGGGLVKHFNGAHNTRCVALLDAITGNIDVRGGNCLPRFYDIEEAEQRPRETAGGDEIPHSSHSPVIPAHQAIRRMKDGKVSCQLYFCHKSNPAFANPDKSLVEEVLKDEQVVPYLVVMDTHMSETAHLADLVLPAATYLESWGLSSPPALDMVPFVALRQPVVSPIGTARPLDEVLLELASRLGEGMKDHFAFNSVEGFIGQLASKIDGLAEAGGLQYLKEHGVWLQPDAEPSYRAYERNGFSTPSGKFEIDSEALKREGLPSIPIYEPIPGHGALGGEFILTFFKPGLHSHRTGNSKWLSEILHESTLWINRVTASELHIGRGDLVKVTSKLGSFVVRAHLTQGIHPSVVAIADGLGHWSYGHIARAAKFKSRDPDTQLVWWGKDWFRVNPTTAIPEWSDPIGGGQAWMDTRVSIMKI